MTTDHPNHKWWTLFAMCFALFMIMPDSKLRVLQPESHALRALRA